MDYLTYVLWFTFKISLGLFVLALIYYYFISEIIKNNKMQDVKRWNNKHVKCEIKKQMRKLKKIQG